MEEDRFYEASKSMKRKTPPVCDYHGSDYQTSFWEKGGRDYEDQAEAIALRRLLPARGDLLLEVGAGAGRNTPRYKGYQHVVLLDYSLTQLQQAQERLGRSDRYTYVAADVYQLPFINALFDGATMIRTLHHMADAPAALREIRRVMRSQGTFILEYANKLNLKAIGRYLIGRQDWSPFTPEPVEFVELNFDFHPQTVRRWLGEEGFQLERQLTVSHFRIGLLKRLVPTKILVFLDSLAQHTGNWWQLTPSVFTRSKAVGDATEEGHLAAKRAGADGFFRCPACGSAQVEEGEASLTCTACSSVWPIQDGIYDFRKG
ncbi:MAG: Demethylrebeccamycin-D-glucose O-methyltransferase [Chloroflexi bacterium]|nr:Demethylrebeccamycin-D-glucose O-methyltransferase [Chloroflexota bacterium]